MTVQYQPPATASVDPLWSKLQLFADLGEAEYAGLSELCGHKLTLPAGADLALESEVGRCAYVLESGWVIRYKLLADGRRQILNFGLPGDFLGIRSGLFGITDQDIAGLTEVRVAVVPIPGLTALFGRSPRLAAAISWSSAREEAILAEHVVRLGRRDAYERLAHLLVELWHRLDVVGLCDQGGFALPATQEVLGDALGLSVVHVNRTLRRLRSDGLISLENGRLDLHDPEALADVAGFDSLWVNEGMVPKRVDAELEAAGQDSAPEITDRAG